MSLRLLKHIFMFMVFVLPGVSVSAQDAVNDAVQKKADEHKLQEFFTKNNLSPQKTPWGLYYIITKEGEGKKIMAGETVTVNYTGRLLDGMVFDSNTDTTFHHMKPFVFEVGQRSVIRGWDKGVQLLKKGSAATLFIPSASAYGPAGSGHIPANSVLIFDIEILDVTK